MQNVELLHTRVAFLFDSVLFIIYVSWFALLRWDFVWDRNYWVGEVTRWTQTS